MRLCALMPCRNEAWILGLSARVSLMWCDSLVILLHSCTDDSNAIACEVAREHEGRVWLIEQAESDWNEMIHRQLMLEYARSADGPNATHIAIVDADEILTANLLPQAIIRSMVEDTKNGILQLPGYNLRGSIYLRHATGMWANRWFSAAFKDDPGLKWEGDRFHHREPMGIHLKPYRPLPQGEAGGVMHLWGVSERRLRAKHALYKMTETLRWPKKDRREIDQTYSWWRCYKDNAWDKKPWDYQQVPAVWWEPYQPLLKHLHIDAVPWQEAACKKLIEEHGRVRFAALDLFGVV